MIFGHFGFAEYGLNGAGFATLIARTIMPLLIMYWFLKSHHYKKYKEYLDLKRIEIKELISLFKFNLPISLQIIIEVIAFSFGGIMMGWFGEVPLAAHQIALGIATFTFMIASGIGSATTIRISFQLGAKQYKALKLAGISSIHLVIAFMTISGVFFMLFRTQLPKLFTEDVEVINIASKLLLFAAVFQIVDGIQLISVSALRGLGDVKYSLWLSVISYGFLSLGASYLFAFVFEWGPEGIWVGYVIGLSVASVLFLRRFLNLCKDLVKN